MNFYGSDATVSAARQRFPISMSGATLSDLMDIATSMGFVSRASAVAPEDAHDATLPAILHWKNNHFVVLKNRHGRHYNIHDPASGHRRVTSAQFIADYSGVLLELVPEGPLIQLGPTEKVRNLIAEVLLRRTNMTGLGLILGLTLTFQCALFIAPLQMQLIFDRVITQGNVELAIPIIVAFWGLLLFQVISEASRNWTTQVFTNFVTASLVTRIFRHLLRLPISFFENRHIGDVLNRMSAIPAINDIVTRGLLVAVVDGVAVLVVSAVVILYSPSLAAIVMAGIALNLAFSIVAYGPNRQIIERQQANLAREQSFMMETVRSAALIKALGGERARESGWRELYYRVLATTQTGARYQILLAAAQSLVSGTSLALVLYFGLTQAMAGTGFTAGMLVAFIAYRQILVERTGTLIGQVAQLGRLRTYGGRLAEITSAEAEADDTSLDATDVTAETIELRNVSFRYGVTDQYALKDISLKIDAGQFVAIVGPSGGGKTTLLKILIGLRQPTSGEILIDGVPANSARWRAWRRRVGYVAQNDHPLVGSVAENIALFSGDICMEGVVAAATTAGLHQEIVKLPMQYRTELAEGGTNLSGGQRQRLMLARALYRDPCVLILDEGTANLDSATEDVIADVIERMTITRIIVAHRPALIAKATRVIEVRDGKLQSTCTPRA